MDRHNKVHWGNTATMPHFPAIGQITANLWRFHSYQYGGRTTSAILDFQKFKISTGDTVCRVNARHCAKFCGDQSNRC